MVQVKYPKKFRVFWLEVILNFPAQVLITAKRYFLFVIKSICSKCHLAAVQPTLSGSVLEFR